MHARIETEETIGLILSDRSQHKRARVARRRFSFETVDAKCTGTKTERKRLNKSRRRCCDRRAYYYIIHITYTLCTCGVL